MIELALRGKIPLIATTTNDPGRVQQCIMHLLKTQDTNRVVPWDAIKSLHTHAGNPKDELTQKDIPANTVIVDYDGEAMRYGLNDLCRMLAQADSTIVSVNLELTIAKAVPEQYFDAGLLPTPETLLEDYLDSRGLGPTLVPALGGLSIKEVDWLVRMAGAKAKAVTAETLLEVRRQLPPHNGLQHVPPVQDPSYVAPRVLADWVESEGPFWLDQTTDPRLVSKGLLFYGQPGVGKTMGAKYISACLGVPLYLYSAAGVLSRFLGDCHSDDTEFLTRRGPLKYGDVRADDELATLNPEGDLEWQRYEARVRKPFDGKMIYLGQRGALVTPTHRCLVKPYESTEGWRWDTAEAFLTRKSAQAIPVAATGWRGSSPEHIEIPAVQGLNGKSYGPIRMQTEKFVEFLGYFVAEGSTTKTRGPVTLTQQEGPLADRMKQLLSLLTPTGHVCVMRDEREHRPTVSLNLIGQSLPMWSWLRANCGHRAAEKQFPDWVMDLDKPLLEILWKALIDTDGSRDKRGFSSVSYCTTSRKLSDQVQELGIKLGKRISLRVQPPQGNRKTRYTISACDRAQCKVQGVEEVAYQGDVVCFTVPNSTLITRREGRWMVSGNSEKAIERVLKAVDREEPCVLLIDEMEKLFRSKTSTDDGGAGDNVLAVLLWWLQERRSRVLVIATTNDKDALPPELIRPGRIGTHIELSPLVGADAKNFALYSFRTYKLTNWQRKLAGQLINTKLRQLIKTPQTRAALQSMVSTAVKEAIRKETR